MAHELGLWFAPKQRQFFEHARDVVRDTAWDDIELRVVKNVACRESTCRKIVKKN
jgi:hypothetical protein